jgi:hypothetical protein
MRDSELPSHVELREQLRTIDETYGDVPSTSLLPVAARLLSEIALLRDATCHVAVRRELDGCEAEAATLMASSSGTHPSDAITRPRAATSIRRSQQLSGSTIRSLPGTLSFARASSPSTDIATRLPDSCWPDRLPRRQPAAATR